MIYPEDSIYLDLQISCVKVRPKLHAATRFVWCRRRGWRALRALRAHSCMCMYDVL